MPGTRTLAVELSCDKLHILLHPRHKLHTLLRPRHKLHPLLHPRHKLHTLLHPRHKLHTLLRPRHKLHPLLHPRHKLHPLLHPHHKLHNLLHPRHKLHALLPWPALANITMPARRRRHDGSTRRTGIPLSQVPRLAVHNNPLAKRRANMPRLHSASGNRHLDSMRHHQRSRDGDAREVVAGAVSSSSEERRRMMVMMVTKPWPPAGWTWASGSPWQSLLSDELMNARGVERLRQSSTCLENRDALRAALKTRP
ncbi:unnamed protein product [Lampetra fluviatilis]